MSFSRKYQKIKLGHRSSYIDLIPQTVSELIDGEEKQRVVYVPVDLSSKEAEASLPKASDYTLDALQQAGIPLETLQIGNLLTPAEASISMELNHVNPATGQSKLSSMFSEIQTAVNESSKTE